MGRELRGDDLHGNMRGDLRVQRDVNGVLAEGLDLAGGELHHAGSLDEAFAFYRQEAALAA